MGTPFVILFLICLVLLPLSLIKPGLINKIIKRNFTRKQFGLILGASLIISFFLVGVTAPPKKDEPVKISTNQSSTLESDPKKVDYEIISYENNKLVENYWLLITTQDKSEENLKSFAKKFKNEKCKKQCNISLYDDKKAVDLDLEYSKIRDITEANTWKEKNYIYVADHLVGYLVFDGDFYNDYPYQDSYYKELKQK